MFFDFFDLLCILICCFSKYLIDICFCIRKFYIVKMMYSNVLLYVIDVLLYLKVFCIKYDVFETFIICY